MYISIQPDVNVGIADLTDEQLRNVITIELTGITVMYNSIVPKHTHYLTFSSER